MKLKLPTTAIQSIAGHTQQIRRAVKPSSLPRPRVLVEVNNRLAEPTSHTTSSLLRQGSFTTAPSLYVVNSTSIAKAHAREHLQCDLAQYCTDVCIISETWLKSHHNTNLYNIDGFTLYRKDRLKKRGGGVAIYISSKVESIEYNMPFDNNNLFELLWIKTCIDSTDCYIASVYFPPKPRDYSCDDF